MKRIIQIVIVFFTIQIVHAQCPTVSCPSILTLTNCQAGQTVIATSNYSANISSRWIGPGNIPIASSGTSTSVVSINHAGTYTVEFKDNQSNCVVSNSINVSDITNKPIFDLFVPSFSMLCTSSNVIIGMQNVITIPSGGAVSYTIIGTPTSSVLPNGPLSGQAIYTINICGNWEAIVRGNSSMCNSSYKFAVSCSTLAPVPLVVSGTNTVCLGSSVTFSSNGTNNFWSTSASGSTMNTIPSVNTTYTVLGNDMNGCLSSGTIAVTTNTTCSQVWPGDANSDGSVDNTDVFEIGLALNATGPVRTPGGNSYVSQFTANWAGTVSTGKNLCHADCNGDGIITSADNLAISSNFTLTHAFKPTASPINNPQVTISSQPIANAGLWNKADIFLGDSSTLISQLYGIAFELDYDQGLIETDSVYLVYTSSFLNNTGQNIEFEKTIFSAGKLYGASVRTDNNNVNGNSKIAEFYFKVKSGVQENTSLNLAVSNVKKIDHTGISSTLSAGSCSILLDGNTTGIEEKTGMPITIAIFPNPASGKVTFYSNSEYRINYSIYDVSGRELLLEEVQHSVTIDLLNYANGAYFIRFDSDGHRAYKKLIVNNK